MILHRRSAKQNGTELYFVSEWQMFLISRRGEFCEPFAVHRVVLFDLKMAFCVIRE